MPAVDKRMFVGVLARVRARLNDLKMCIGG
jgi:hypothetical protein